MRYFFRLWPDRQNQPGSEQMSAEERRDFYIPYNQAKRALHGKALYFFLAGEIIKDLQKGFSNEGEQYLAEFLQDNPHPEYTEVVEEVVREASKLKPGQSLMSRGWSAALRKWRLERCHRQKANDRSCTSAGSRIRCCLGNCG